MNSFPNDTDLLDHYGWEVERDTPLEISTKDGSRAIGEAAKIVLNHLRLIHKKEGDHVGEKCPFCKSSIRKNVIRDIKGCTNKDCSNYYHKKESQ